MKPMSAMLARLSAAVLVVVVFAGCKSRGHGCHSTSDPVVGSASRPLPPMLPSPSATTPTVTPALPNAVPKSTTKYGGQKTCPVMGDELGSMGEAIPVTVKGETIFVCCRGCVRRVQADPEKYVAIVRAERAAP